LSNSKTEVKEWVELCPCCPCVPSWRGEL